MSAGFGSYKLKSVLGEGGYATVYLATRPEGGAVALKVLKAAYLENARVRRSFKREARLHRTLAHENIVPCHGLARDGRGLAIVLDVVRGGPLAPVAADDQDLRPRVAALRQVGEALAYLHERAIIHLDLKPGNILVNERGTPKLTDFSLAYRRTPVGRLLRLLRRGPIPGSPAYMAPEVIRGEEPDLRSDLYSLGAVMYHVLAGKPPFEAALKQEVLRMHVEAIPAPPRAVNPRIPPALEALIYRLLIKDRSKRLGSARAVCRELAAASVAGVRAPVT